MTQIKSYDFTNIILITSATTTLKKANKIDINPVNKNLFQNNIAIIIKNIAFNKPPTTPNEHLSILMRLGETRGV